MFASRKLALTLVFAVLIALAAGVSCQGFFQKNDLESIAIQPPSPQIEAGTTETLQAWGTYEDNSRAQITSGVIWTSSDASVVQIDQNSGVATGEGTGGTATITAAAQGISATATATVYLGTVTNFQICSGTFGTGTCPASSWIVSGTSGGSQTFYVQADYNSKAIDLTTAATFAVAPTVTTGSFTCSNSTSPATCTVDSGTSPTGSYTITVTYGTSYSAVEDVTID